MYRALNVTTGHTLAEHVQKAESFLERSKGLLGRDELASSHGLWITPCKSIHTFFMKFPIDAVFINSEGTVVGLYSHLKPYRITKVFCRASSTLELPAGSVWLAGTELGHLVQFEERT